MLANQQRMNWENPRDTKRLQTRDETSSPGPERGQKKWGNKIMDS